MGIETGSAPTDLPNLVEVGVAGFECGALFEGVGCELGGERVESQRIIAGGDIDAEIAPGAPPERLKDSVCAAVGEEAVG